MGSEMCIRDRVTFKVSLKLMVFLLPSSTSGGKAAKMEGVKSTGRERRLPYRRILWTAAETLETPSFTSPEKNEVKVPHLPGGAGSAFLPLFLLVLMVFTSPQQMGPKCRRKKGNKRGAKTSLGSF